MKILNLFTSLLVVSLLFSTQTFAQKITGKGGTVKEKIDLPTITGVGLGISADVYLKQGSSQEITLSKDRKTSLTILKEKSKAKVGVSNLIKMLTIIKMSRFTLL